MSLFEATIGLLAPPQCIVCGFEGASLCKSCANSVITPFGERCWQCTRLSPRSRTCTACRPNGSPSHVWLSTNYEAAARELVRTYKFHHQRAAADSLAAIMSRTLLTYSSQADLETQDYLIVPIPTASKRIRQRSFDHTKLLARSLSRRLKLKRADVLGRLGQISQVGAPRSLRLTQAGGQYFVRNPKAVVGHSILLFDDVVTTGATLRAVTKILRAAGAKHVDALVFAKRL